ncbi:radical SAM protein [Bdellovibrio reynosensis]|uniref:Radical SAM protein n=1 Tax=Bdellovibrio reynosensis TaxID=2835041 RepID=A0ABY4C4S6_9BACT|nr:radical SAM protein [Bdellovibrio reynosensis]UOE99946.1 radical SAM protein [Bdellovibrio reynosensis]
MFKHIKDENSDFYFNPITLEIKYQEPVENTTYEEAFEHAHEVTGNYIQKNILVTRARIVLTEQCNFRCKYCFVMDQHAKLVDMPEENIDKVCDFLENYGDPEGLLLQLFGGEPLTKRHYIQRILERFKNSPLYDNLRFEINSNGSLVRRLDFEAFEEHRDKILFTLSLDSDLEELNDKYRVLISGRGTFKLTLEGIQQLIENNFAVNLLYTPMNETLPRLPRLVAFAKSIGVKQLSVNSPQPGKGDWEVNGTLLYKSLKAARKVAEKIGFDFASELDKVDYVLSEKIPNIGPCTSLSGMAISISPKGRISNCIVNWNDHKDLTQGMSEFDINKARIFKNRRKAFALECRQCIAHSVCGGACGLELALGNTGPSSAIDNKCQFYRLAVTDSVTTQNRKKA